MKETCFFDMIAPNAPGFLTHNIITDIDSMNGVEIKYISVFYKDSQVKALFEEMVQNTPSGRSIRLPPPSAINVQQYIVPGTDPSIGKPPRPNYCFLSSCLSNHPSFC